MADSVLKLVDVSPSIDLEFGEPQEVVELRLAAIFKGDPGITGLRYVNVVDAEGNLVATLLTGDIQS